MDGLINPNGLGNGGLFGDMDSFLSIPNWSPLNKEGIADLPPPSDQRFSFSGFDHSR